MTEIVKPMLASAAETIKYPVFASTKLDGIRALAINGVPTSRNGKPIRNQFVQDYFKIHPEMNGLDGELIVGSPFAKDLFQVTTSGVMSGDGQPDFKYYVFDVWNDDNKPYDKRLIEIATRSKHADRVVVVEQRIIGSEAELLAFETEALALGYEGLIVRSIDGRYKHGRSSAKEGLLLKVKRFTDGEAKVVGVKELESNQNEKTKDVFGNSERSSHKDGMVPMDTLGALSCIDEKGRSFDIGTGFTAEVRKALWIRAKSKCVKDEYVGLNGLFAKYKHFEIGAKDAPRFPVFLGFRDKDDMSK